MFGEEEVEVNVLVGVFDGLEFSGIVRKWGTLLTVRIVGCEITTVPRSGDPAT